jgi:D-alanine-D-alanine ligase
VRQDTPHNQTDLHYPLFVKPLDRGGGLGIDAQSVVYDEVQLQTKLQSLTNDYQADALVETYLPGREFSVAILKDELFNSYSTMPLELIAPLDEHGHRLLSDAVKTADTETFLPVETGVLKESIKRLALKVFHAIGAQDYGRIDIRLDAHGVPQFLEANLIPSLLDHYGNFPKACLLNEGLAYEPMLLQIVALGLKRAEVSVLESLDFAIEFGEAEIAPQIS